MTKRYGLLIDLDRCTGRRTCTVACKMENRLDQVSGIRVETVGGPLRDTPAGKYPNLSMYYLTVPCMHSVASRHACHHAPPKRYTGGRTA